MSPLSRREFIRDAAAGVSMLSLSGHSLARSLKSHALTRSSNLYLIIQGPWIFSLPPAGSSSQNIPFDIQAFTPDFSGSSMKHTYDYLNPEAFPSSGNNLPIIGTVATGAAVSITVNRTSNGKSAADLFNQMKLDGPGLFLSNSSLAPQTATDATLRRITLPNPDQVLPLGLISGATITADKNLVTAWPSALAFVYSDWSAVTVSGLSNSTEPSVTISQTGPTIRLFRICHPSTDRCTEICHATDYFNSLMNLLSFSGGVAAPTVKFPDCKNDKPVGITLSGNSDLACRDLGDLNACAAGTIHPTPAKNSTTQLRPVPPGHENERGATLVNCASGGGITGCC